jgi:hypothetical protein
MHENCGVKRKLSMSEACKPGESAKKKPPRLRGLKKNDFGQILQLNNIISSRTFRAVNNFILDPGTLIEGFETISFDSRVMNEHVVATVLLNKTKTLRCIKPFYCTFFHLNYSFMRGPFLEAI